MNTKLLLSAGCVYLFFLGCSKEKAANQKEQLPVQTKGALLSANGTTDTYLLINSVLGGKGDVLETPDCAHAGASPHIKQVFDADLNKQVFAFTIHVTPDNDKCNGKTDRQRNEIKTYDASPDSLKATLNETVEYRWKFKLDAGFKPSPNFTHLHQIKPTDGDDDLPIITLTARYKAAGDQLEVIHTAGDAANTLKYLASVPLSDFKGHWVEAIEKVTYSGTGKYELLVRRISDARELVSIKVDHIDTWRTGTTTCRPKWGIYRSLLSPTFIRDETILFNDFKITEIK